MNICVCAFALFCICVCVCPLCVPSCDRFIMLRAEMAMLKISHKPVHPQPRPVLRINSLAHGSLHPLVKCKLFLLHIPHGGANPTAAKTGVKASHSALKQMRRIPKQNLCCGENTQKINTEKKHVHIQVYLFNCICACLNRVKYEEVCVCVYVGVWPAVQHACVHSPG